MDAVSEFGVWIGHGDLLTVKMVQEARMLMQGSLFYTETELNTP